MADPYDTDMADRAVTPPLRQVLASLHYAYPTAIFLYYMVTSTIAVCTLQTKSSEQSHPRRRAISWLLMFIILTYFTQLLTLVARGIIQHVFPPADQDVIIGLLSCTLVFGVVFAGLSETSSPVWHPYVGSLGLALVFEPAIQALAFAVRPAESLVYTDLVDISTASARYLAVILAVAFYLEGKCNWQRGKCTDSERQSLLKTNGNAGHHDTDSEDSSDGGQQNGYGATSDVSTDASQSSDTDGDESPWERRERQASEQMEKRLKEKGNWVTYAKSFMVFFPYIWPVGRRSLQIRVVLVGACLLTMNFINVLIPRQLGIIMDSLAGTNNKNPWVEVLFFAGLKLVASEAGLSLLRQWLWIPVEYYSFDAISTASYSHVLNLSSDFHDSKSSSDIMMAIQSGQSVSNILESICFRAIPMLIDMVVAFLYLSVTLGPYEGFITVATASVFLYIATRMIAGLKSARKDEVSAWFREHYVRQAGIQGWSTVACFNQIGHEESRYSAAVKDRVSKSQKVYFGYVVAYAFQFLVLLSGLLAGAFLAVYQVTHDQATPGMFIMLLTYWAQLVAPLNFFAGLGRSISRDLLHAEQLLEIMQTKPTILTKEGAPPLQFSGGEVRFDHVWFSYDKKKEILKDINFTATPGMTVAFVGATGAGKSTILKLLDRFYDVTKGSIQIDGQDIRDVDLYSLRAQVGIVPQAPILFDDTIMNNVRYAKLNATDDEVYEACKAASIHEQILGFSDGTLPNPGWERGIKLSGGELQRVAIARAILKRPSIVLLDEATSAVDTETEQKIQEALRTLCENRTTFIVAHRLSTIMNADRIIVVTGGELVEQGNHEDLIRANGKYAELWSKQIFVKPKDTEPPEDKPVAKGRKTPNIVNDLSPEATSSELAKVNPTPNGKTNGNTESDGKPAFAAGHKKEV
ncbi:Heavy metal tolerance protein [Madurella mycetomatis]|uniref:Heavy metal tolerance protein n=1 Tax=Madurella mycetomatis TaxID=100816 RepID=A0A175WH83_9PEZI|nr:Heavy metal tolerance protein [Madurella mycetomatis]